MRFKARRLLKFAQRFPTSTLGQKINLVWGQKSPVVYRKNFKEFLGFPKSLLALGSSRCGLKKITASQCPKFLEMRFKARRLLKFAQRFPTSTLGQKINLVWGQKSPVVYRKNFKEFLGFPKIAQQHSRGSCVHWKRRIKL